MFRIMLDPGHNEMQNPYYGKWGAMGITEGRQMFKLSGFIIDYINRNFKGVQVDRTKTIVNSDPSLEARGRMAKGYNLFLSLHTNAWTIETRGTQMYYAAGDADGSSRKLAAFLADEIGDKVFDHADSVSKAVLRLYPNTSNVSYYGVLRAAEQTGVGEAIMGEFGFHTNDEDLELIATDAGLQKITQVLSNALASWYGWQRKTQTGGTGGGTATPGYKSYTVLAGESPWSIAAKLLGDGNRYKEIVALNGFAPPYILMVGQVIKVPLSSKIIEVKPIEEPQEAKSKIVQLEVGAPIMDVLPTREIEKEGYYTVVKWHGKHGKIGQLKAGGFVYVPKGESK